MMLSSDELHENVPFKKAPKCFHVIEGSYMEIPRTYDFKKSLDDIANTHEVDVAITETFFLRQFSARAPWVGGFDYMVVGVKMFKNADTTMVIDYLDARNEGWTVGSAEHLLRYAKLCEHKLLRSNPSFYRKRVIALASGITSPSGRIYTLSLSTHRRPSNGRYNKVSLLEHSRGEVWDSSNAFLLVRKV